MPFQQWPELKLRWWTQTLPQVEKKHCVCHSVHSGWGGYRHMPCRWYPSMPCRSPGGHPSMPCRFPGPHPGSSLRGLAGGVSRPTAGGVSQHALRHTPSQLMATAVGGMHPTVMLRKWYLASFCCRRHSPNTSHPSKCSSELNPNPTSICTHTIHLFQLWCCLISAKYICHIE